MTPEGAPGGFRVMESKARRPIDLYGAARRRSRYTALLESLGEYDGDTARYTILGVVPRHVLRGRGDDATLEDVRTGEVRRVSWLDTLDQWTSARSSAPDGSPLSLGAIGFIGYEARFALDTLQRRIRRERDGRTAWHGHDVFLVDYAVLFVHDRALDRSWWVVANDQPAFVCNELEREALIDTSPRALFRMIGDVTPDFTKAEYLSIVDRAIEFIRNGDIFQANVTMRFHSRYAGDPLVLYRRLREITPNPFCGYLDFDEPMMSTSPERFVKIERGTIRSNPIKGTARCIVDGVDQRDVLRASVKDNAENTMIVDLVRNDIGRVCRQGTVEVPGLCQVKKFNSLYHLESIVQGRLKDGVSTSDVLRAVFPGGSITGAPKVRAEDIIEELELTTRGPYTGLTGFFGHGGWTHTSIAIRVLYCDDGRLFFHSGGGIVVDSVAEDEYRELLLKVEALQLALGELKGRG